MTRDLSPTPEVLDEDQSDENFPPEDEPGFDMPKIGKFVEQHVLAIAEHCDRHPDEFQRLLDDAYSKETLDLNYPLFRKPELLTGKYASKYRKSPQVVACGETVHFTNDWYARHYVTFIKYLDAKHIIENELAEAYLDSLPEPGIQPTKGGAGTPGLLQPIHIGNAQNLFVRNILGRVRPDEQSYGGWQSTWEWFNGECAYCGVPLRKFDKDHVYSINYLNLGEHKRGNLVPACKDCNKEKSDADFRTFLASKHVANQAEAMERVSKIQRFMADRDYSPLVPDVRNHHADHGAPRASPNPG